MPRIGVEGRVPPRPDLADIIERNGIIFLTLGNINLQWTAWKPSLQKAMKRKENTDDNFMVKSLSPCYYGENNSACAPDVLAEKVNHFKD